jgi:hypothetical protein
MSKPIKRKACAFCAMGRMLTPGYRCPDHPRRPPAKLPEMNTITRVERRPSTVTKQ